MTNTRRQFTPPVEAFLDAVLGPEEPTRATRPKHPTVKVRLTGTDGNAFAIIGKVRLALRRAGVPAEEVEAFSEEAMRGDYDHVLQTCMNWVEVS
jgi:hypothetical protein